MLTHLLPGHAGGREGVGSSFVSIAKLNTVVLAHGAKGALSFTPLIADTVNYVGVIDRAGHRKIAGEAAQYGEIKCCVVDDQRQAILPCGFNCFDRILQHLLVRAALGAGLFRSDSVDIGRFLRNFDSGIGKVLYFLHIAAVNAD